MIERVEQRQQIGTLEAMHQMGQGLTQLARQIEQVQKKVAAIEKRVDRLGRSKP